jgi:hypothetical protein
VKGGHASSGPLRDPNALRRDRRSDAADVVHLPAAGRKGRAPAWPLTESTKREDVLWAAAWRKPQAVEWQRLQLVDEVAVYVRSLARFEGPEGKTTDGTLVKQLQENLGLSAAGLSRRGWVIDDVSPAPKVTKADDPDRTSAKSRFKTLEGGAA